MYTTKKVLSIIMISLYILVFYSMPKLSSAHCDTLDGPVIKDTKIALEKGGVTPVLKWVKKEYEDEIRKSFKKTLAVTQSRNWKYFLLGAE